MAYFYTISFLAFSLKWYRFNFNYFKIMALCYYALIYVM